MTSSLHLFIFIYFLIFENGYGYFLLIINYALDDPALLTVHC